MDANLANTEPSELWADAAGLLLQALTAALVVAAYWDASPHLLAAAFGAAVVAAGLPALLYRPLSHDPAEPTPTTAVIAAAVSGLIWGGGLALFQMQGPGPGGLPPFALAAATLAVALGNGLRPAALLAFALVAQPLGLAAELLLGSGATAAYLLLLGASGLLVLAAIRQRQRLARYYAVGRQNAHLLVQLAQARDEAVHSQHEAERANGALKLQMHERELAEARTKHSERELASILHDMQDTYFRTDRDGILLHLSPSVEPLLGRTPQELTGRPWRELLFEPDEYAGFIAALDDNFGRVESHEIRLRDHRGEPVWVSLNSHYYTAQTDDEDELGAVAGFEGTARDVTAIRRAAEALFQEKERLHVTLESIAEGVIATDVRGAVDFLNPIAEDMTGWNAQLARGMPLDTVLDLVNETEGQRITLPMAEWLAGDSPLALPESAMLVRRGGQQQSAIEMAGAPIRDSHDTLIGAVLVFRDITRLRSLARQLAYQATHDALTDLVNRVEFETRVQQALRTAQQSGKEHALCYLDLDHFKIVNDTCGHHAGDELLKRLTTLLAENLRESDTLARLGGDEFGILLSGCPLEKAEDIAEKLRAAVDAYRFPCDNQLFGVSLSIGLVPITAAAHTLTELLQHADAACYVAKDTGRNNVHVYCESDTALATQQEQAQWIPRLQRALDHDLFQLYFQPIAPLLDEGDLSLHGELLLRLVDRSEADAEPQLPAAFLPAAERYHLMPQIDRWVVRNALPLIAAEPETLGTWTINLSGQSLNDPHLADFLLEAIRASGVPASRLCFEITENAVIANLEQAQQLARQLKRAGCHFALDDFGSGISAFDYLRDLPVDYVKLDGGLVRNVAVSKVSQAMVHAINYVAHVMGMKSIAESVENGETAEALKAISVDHMQGYHVGRPRPVTRA